MATVKTPRDVARTSSAPEEAEPSAADRRRLRAERARTAIGRLLRYGGLFVGAVLGWSVGGSLAARPELVFGSQLFLASLLAALGFLTTPYLVFDLVDALLLRLRVLTLEAIIAGGLGAFAGAILGLVLAWPLALLPRPAGQLVPPAVAVLATAVGALVGHSRRAEVLAVLGRVPSPRQPAVVLDTSALIDGRIRAVIRAGFLYGTVLVPEEVLRELHRLAESRESARQARGRRGLELLRRLREELGSSFVVLPALEPPRVTDEAVVLRCGEFDARLVTCDQQLAQVARLRGLTVLNPHQLADALRDPIHAGDRLLLHLTGPGREPHQAIGYLEDGTLVVVEQAQQDIGRDVWVEVTRTLQTASGRLVFARLVRQDDA
ncbi:MAG: hypothetical protein RMH81_01945 [Thermomicrobium sp.]|nr:hypothetical protein [Thermomicrobium sp.]